MADARPTHDALPAVTLRTELTLLKGGRPPSPAAPAPDLLHTFPAAFARFCELCPERGLVDRPGLVAGVLALAETAHPGTAFSLPAAEQVDLPIAALVRDALWQAGRSGRLEPVRAALAQAQLRLGLLAL